MYQIYKRDGKQTLTEEQVDTSDGPLFRVIAIDGEPLNSGRATAGRRSHRSLLRDPKPAS